MLSLAKSRQRLLVGKGSFGNAAVQQAVGSERRDTCKLLEATINSTRCRRETARTHMEALLIGHVHQRAMLTSRFSRSGLDFVLI